MLPISFVVFITDSTGIDMTKHHDLTGQLFGRLVVILEHPERDKQGSVRWVCKCDPENCGNIITVAAHSLKSSNTSSCGCLRSDIRRKAMTKHGLRNTPEYRVWKAMKNRCYNTKSESYANYGEQGITICDEWKDDFEAFYRDMGPKPTPEHSIDRRDNDKGYNKENCRWATRIEQASNKKNSVFYTYDGKSRTLTGWCRELGLDYDRTYKRIRRGAIFEEAIGK